MKRKEKIKITAEAIRVLLNLFKEAHNLSDYAERYEDSSCNGCYPSDEEEWDTWCADCNSNCRDMPYNIMIQLLDKDKRHICSNWLNNSKYPEAYWWDNPNCLTSTLSSYYDLDLHHITWGAGNVALAKARYIRVFTRGETDCGDEFSRIDRGYELDIYHKRYYQFVKTVYDNALVHDYVY